MTREDAIQILRTRIVPTRNWQEIHEAIDMAIEALSVIDIVDLTNGNTITKAEYEMGEETDLESLNTTIKNMGEEIKRLRDDRPLVVRCKDCRHRGLFSCPLADNDFQKDDDYCSWGELAEQTDKPNTAVQI